MKVSYVTRYGKIDHLQENMILQDRVLKSPELFFFQIFFLSFCESMIFSVFIHKFSSQYNVNYCNDWEKEGTLVLASYVHGLTVIIDQ